MHPITISHPGRDPQDDLVDAANAIRTGGWWQAAEVEERWPLTTEDAAMLLKVGAGYAVDADGLHDLINRGLLQPPQAVGEWNSHDVILAAGILELRRQFEPNPGRHDAKKFGCEIILDQARAGGVIADIAHGGPAQFDVRHVLELLVRSNSYEDRRKIASLLDAILEVDHGVTV